MNTENATQMTRALAQRGHESIVVASGDILIATAKAKLHAAEKVRTILPATAKFDGKKWATTYEGQYVTDPAEIARLRDEAKLNDDAALRLGKIQGKGDAQEVFLKSGPVVEMDKKAISEYMKGLDKQEKARSEQAEAPAKPKAPKAKQSEGEVGKRVARNVAKKEDPKVKQDEGEAGKKVARNVARKEDPKTTEGKNFRAEAPSAKEAAKKTTATAAYDSTGDEFEDEVHQLTNRAESLVTKPDSKELDAVWDAYHKAIKSPFAKQHNGTDMPSVVKLKAVMRKLYDKHHGE
jgi:hypothetical protein